MGDLPELRVQHKKANNQHQFDLRRFLYIAPRARNGKTLSADLFVPKIYKEDLRPDKLERLSLLIKVKEYFEESLELGFTLSSQKTYVSVLQYFFNFFDNNGRSVTLENIEESYYEYCEHLFQLSNNHPPKIKKITAYHYGFTLSKIISNIIELPKGLEPIKKTRLHHPKLMKTSVSKEADKQNLEDTRKMGSFLVDLVSGITVEKVLGELPLRIPLREGLVENNEIMLNTGEPGPSTKNLLSKPFESLIESEKKAVRQFYYRLRPIDSIKGTARWRFVNLRVVAEYLIFIAQTGINPGQAKSLKRKGFKYWPSGDSWQVRAYKHRRGGEVVFSIYKSYKPYLKEHLIFIDHFFPESDLLFPNFNSQGRPSLPGPVFHTPIRTLLIENGLPWISPRTLRKSRVNWMHRRSGGDTELTAEMHQHFQETLREKYELPSQQRTVAEITKFWNIHDPINREKLKPSIISGQCSGDPAPTDDKPSSVVAPDCSNPTGCLWCKHFRDIDSFDYVWSLTSFRHLKTIEAAGVITQEVVPADIVVERLTQKITWFREASEKRAEWVEEAEVRMTEGHYHPHWSGILEFLEE